MFCHLCYVVDLYTLDVVVSAYRFSCRVLTRCVHGSCPLLSSCCFAVVRVVIVFPRFCVRFFNISLFLIFFCSCVGQTLFDHITNVLRHGRENMDYRGHSKPHTRAVWVAAATSSEEAELSLGEWMNRSPTHPRVPAFGFCSQFVTWPWRHTHGCTVASAAMARWQKRSNAP